ncbi:MAG: hypothetical protein U0894_16440 [Pirellulales bacterium]
MQATLNLAKLPGIETTTGPLGQGVANSVGMAMAAKWFAAKYNKPGFDLFGFNVYALWQRWRPDGRYCQRSRIGCRSPEAE